MEDSRPPAGRFIEHACNHWGSRDEFRERVRPLYGKTPSRSTVDFWISGTNDPPSWLLFKIAQAWKLSLDEFALDEEDRRALQDQLREVRVHLAIVQEHVQRLLALQGQKPMEFPRSVGTADGN